MINKLTNLDLESLPSKPSEVKYQYRRTPLSPIPERELSHVPHIKTSVDDMLDSIGFGRYQILCYVGLGFILINNGAELIVLSFLIAVLQNDPKWLLSGTQIQFLSCTFFIGMLIGSLYSGKVADRYGRRPPLIVIVFLMYVLGMLSAAATSYPSLIFVRACHSVLMGLQFPMCHALLSEITPPAARARMTVLSGGFLIIGKIFACLVAWGYLNNILTGNWRALFVWAAQPAIICFIILIYYVRESPKYLLLIQRNLEEGLAVMEHIATTNHYHSPRQEAAGPTDNGASLTPTAILTEKQKRGLVVWAQSQDRKFAEETIGSVGTLWIGDYKNISLNIWAVWFSLAIAYYGINYITPLLLAVTPQEVPFAITDTNKTQISQTLMTIFAEIPAIAVGYWLVAKDGAGRKKSMVICFFMGGAACFLAAFFPRSAEVLFLSISRFFITTCFISAAPCLIELYPVSIRATGMGFATAFSQFGGILMPWIALGLYEASAFTPLIAFSVSCVVAALCCRGLPSNTTGVDLDFQEIPHEYHEMSSFPAKDSATEKLSQDT